MSRKPESMIGAMEEVRAAGRELRDEIFKALGMYKFLDWLNSLPEEWQERILFVLCVILLLPWVLMVTGGLPQ